MKIVLILSVMTVLARAATPHTENKEIGKAMEEEIPFGEKPVNAAIEESPRMEEEESEGGRQKRQASRWELNEPCNWKDSENCKYNICATAGPDFISGTFDRCTGDRNAGTYRCECKRHQSTTPRPPTTTPLGAGRCNCHNPFGDFTGDPENTCKAYNLCYVPCNSDCRDITPAAGKGRCQSKVACQVRDNGKNGKPILLRTAVRG